MICRQPVAVTILISLPALASFYASGLISWIESNMRNLSKQNYKTILSGRIFCCLVFVEKQAPTDKKVKSVEESFATVKLFIQTGPVGLGAAVFEKVQEGRAISGKPKQ